MKKRIFAFLLVILMMFSFIPTSIFAQEIVDEEVKEEVTEVITEETKRTEESVLAQEDVEEGEETKPETEEATPVEEKKEETLATTNAASTGVWVNGINVSKGTMSSKLCKFFILVLF